GVLQVLAAVADALGDPRALVGVSRVIVPPDLDEQRVDLDRVDVPGSLGEGDRDVVPVPGPDDQDVAQAGAGDVLVGQEEELLIRVYRGERMNSLMGNVVRGYEKYGIPAALMQGQFVVGCPHLARRQRLPGQQNDHRAKGHDLPYPGPWQKNNEKAAAGD